MFWLITQIIFLLCLAAIGGGLIGWALRCRKCEHDTQGLRDSLAMRTEVYVEPEDKRVSGGIGGYNVSTAVEERIRELQEQLDAEREEVSGLKSKLMIQNAGTGSSGLTVKAGPNAFSGSEILHEDKIAELTWRNRYLESRVRFLGAKLDDHESSYKEFVKAGTEASLHSDETVNEHKPIDGIDGLNELTDQVDDGEVEIPLVRTSYAPDSPDLYETDYPDVVMTQNEQGLDIDPKLEDLQSLMWRNRYLEGRVKYLEEENSYLSEEVRPSNSRNEVRLNDETVYPASAKDSTLENVQTEEGRLQWRLRYLESKVKFLEEDELERKLVLSVEEDLSDELQPDWEIATRHEVFDKESSLKTERLKWRNEYLQTQLSYRDEAIARYTNSRVNLPNKDHDNQSMVNLRSKWRELYWTERERYLHSRHTGLTNNSDQMPNQFYKTEIDRLRWRIAYLDEKLSKQNNKNNDKAPETIVPVRPEVETSFTELHRLKWNNEYLEKKMSLQSEARLKRTAEIHDSEARHKNIMAMKLRWRDLYSARRVEQIEQVKLLDDPTDREQPQLNELSRLTWRNRYLEERIQYLSRREMNTSNTEQAKEIGVPSIVERPGDALDLLYANKKADQVADSQTTKSDVSLDSIGAAAELANAIEAKTARTRAQGKVSNKRKAARKSKSFSTELNQEEFQESFKRSEYFVEGDSKSGRPAYLTQPLLGKADELREIAGVGPKIEKILHELGIFHFYQIAAWTGKEVEWVDSYLTFKGRIDREGWIEQSKKLANGEETDGQKKYRSGKHT